MRINPQSIARASATHPWRTLGIWVAVLAAGIAGAATLLGPALTTDFDFTNSPEAKRAEPVMFAVQIGDRNREMAGTAITLYSPVRRAIGVTSRNVTGERWVTMAPSIIRPDTIIASPFPRSAPMKKGSTRRSAFTIARAIASPG